MALSCMDLDLRGVGRARTIDLGGHHIKCGSLSFERGGVHKNCVPDEKSYGGTQQGLETSLPFINK